jgi:hypothetical protein
MAVVQINGVQLPFSLDTFDELARARGAVFGNRIFKSELQPLRDLLVRAVPPVQPQEVIRAIDVMPLDKRQKYREVIDYVAFHYPGLIPASAITQMPDPRTGTNFHAEYGLMQPGDHVDLVYGLAMERGLAPYSGVNARYCDKFNRAANIGNGVAFRREWIGMGELGTTVAGATASIIATTEVQGLKEGITQANRRAHVNGLMASRLNPVTALEMDRVRIRKDQQKTAQQVQTWNNLPDGDRRIQEHLWAHARMVKGVRRACKGGIAMVASAPAYQAVNAKIHFVLDGMRDLGAVALKQPLPHRGPFVAITTSELVFCHRYWNDPAFPLSAIVKFYINGSRVRAPWEGDWRLTDFNNNEVVSNQEAWLRYELARSMRSVPKSFPAF